VIRGICDTPDRLVVRAYLALWVECGCCTFYRGAILLGVPVGAVLMAALHWVLS